LQVKLLMKGIGFSACLYEPEEQWLSTQSAEDPESCVKSHSAYSSIVTVIDDLERHHFVTRTRHLHDRRLYLITLTPAGQEAYQQAQQGAKRSEEAYFSCFTQEQREQLRMLLQQLLQKNSDHSL
jgi:hypothetical protein